MRKLPKGIHIRAVELGDVDAIVEMFNQPTIVAGTLQVPYASTDDWREKLSKRRPGFRSLVVVEHGRIIALGSVDIFERARMRHVAGIGMTVREEAQGRGIGGVLLDALIELGERWYGVLRFELDVWVDNARAISLYRRRGFAVEGIARAMGMRDGHLVDALKMARVAEKLPWPRVTAESAANRPPPQLPPTRKRDAKHN